MTTERDKMLAGEPYDPGDPELTVGRARAVGLTVRINAEPDRAARRALANQLVRASDGAAVIVPGFFCDYGDNIRLGARAFVNANCVFLDCAEIVIGDDFQCGPGVQLLTPEHPLDATERKAGLESARPIRIGDDVWLGGGAVVLAGSDDRRPGCHRRRRRGDQGCAVRRGRGGQSGPGDQDPAAAGRGVNGLDCGLERPRWTSRHKG